MLLNHRSVCHSGLFSFDFVASSKVMLVKFLVSVVLNDPHRLKGIKQYKECVKIHEAQVYRLLKVFNIEKKITIDLVSK